MSDVRIVDIANRDAFEKPAVWGWWAYNRDGEEVDRQIGFHAEEQAAADAQRRFGEGEEIIMRTRLRDGETGELLPV
jgi:hypothetical protein